MSSTANIFRDIYGEHSIASGTLYNLLMSARYEIIAKVKLVKPAILNQFADKITIADGAFTIDIDKVHDILTIMYGSHILRRLDPDRIYYLRNNAASIHGGSLSPAYAVEFESEASPAAKQVIFYPVALDTVDDGDWIYYYIPQDSGFSLGSAAATLMNATSYNNVPQNLFRAWVKQAIVLQLTKDIDTHRKSFIDQHIDLTDKITDTVLAIFKDLLVVQDELHDIDQHIIDEELEGIISNLGLIDDAIAQMQTFIKDEDIEMVQATGAKIQSSLSQLQGYMEVFSTKWTQYSAIKNVAINSLVGGLNGIAQLMTSFQGSVVAFTQSSQAIMARKQELVEEIVSEIKGA